MADTNTLAYRRTNFLPAAPSATSAAPTLSALRNMTMVELLEVGVAGTDREMEVSVT